MSWKDSEKAAAENAFFKLSNDGDKADVLFLDEPRPVKKRGKDANREVLRFYFTLYADKKVLTWDVSKRTMETIRELPKRGLGERFTVTRHGIADSAETRYDFAPKPLTASERKWLNQSGLMEKASAPPDDDTIPF